MCFINVRAMICAIVILVPFSVSSHQKVVVVPLGDEKIATIADDGIIDDSEASDDLSIDNGLLKAISGGSLVDVDGQVTERATYSKDGVTSTETVSGERYIIESSPATVGVVQALDHEIVKRLCQDLDGCDIYVGMVNWDLSQPGNVASSKNRIFYSQVEIAGDFFVRLDTGATARDGDNSIVNLISIFDCIVGDAESSTNSSNGRVDSELGLGLLNIRGGSYSDVNVTCRVIIED